jgi:2-polyprenyl-3-methyl-5-hydroxy-6-metoxy-1,4-benzoquinol methylase
MRAESETLEVQRSATRRYWDAHPIATDSVPYPRGTRESFDAIFQDWERRMDPRRLAFLDSCAGKSVLEVGCGIAVDGRYLASLGARYQAVDLSRESLRLAVTHFALKGLRGGFANADATRLPFADGSFDVVMSIGVLHHVPDMESACREVVRVTRPGGIVRIMLYNRRSYHFLLVDRVVRPLMWLLQKLPFGAQLARFAPRKFQQIDEICRRHGFDRQRVLSASTDWSEPGEGNFNPLSHFVSAGEARRLFAGLTDFQFYRTDLKYFPIPWLRAPVERYFGFFLQMTARKPDAA